MNWLRDAFIFIDKHLSSASSQEKWSEKNTLSFIWIFLNKIILIFSHANSANGVMHKWEE